MLCRNLGISLVAIVVTNASCTFIAKFDGRESHEGGTGGDGESAGVGGLGRGGASARGGTANAASATIGGRGQGGGVAGEAGGTSRGVAGSTSSAGNNSGGSSAVSGGTAGAASARNLTGGVIGVGGGAVGGTSNGGNGPAVGGAAGITTNGGVGSSLFAGAPNTSAGRTSGSGGGGVAGGVAGTSGTSSGGGAAPIVKAISLGTYHSCAMYDNGTVKCWGRNESYELGLTNADGTIYGISTATAISAGYSHTCALRADGAVKCWGINNGCQLGSGSTIEPGYLPITVASLANASDVAAGGDRTCAIVSGQSYCWGGTTTCSPTALNGAVNSVALSMGRSSACAVNSTGSIKCWGDNTYGELGDGTTTSRWSTAVPVSGIVSATGVVVGEGHACAVSATGLVQCWGDNTFGQLGIGNLATTMSSTPIDVVGVVGASKIATKSYLTCGLFVTGGTSAVKCWGLLNATKTPTPTMIDIGGDAKAIAVGYQHACIIRGNGRVACWGLNDYGQLGDGTIVDSWAKPVDVIGL